MFQKKIDLRKFYSEIERYGVRPTFISSVFHKTALEHADKFQISETFSDPEGRKMVEIRLRQEGTDDI